VPLYSRSYASPYTQRQHGRIALIGDLHSAWDAIDAGYFNDSAYDLLLFVGDLGASGRHDGLAVARSLAKLSRPALIMPGNNDAPQFPALCAEFTYRRSQVDLLREFDAARHPRASGAKLCGFSAHPIAIGGLDVTIIAGRPFASGGGELSFPDSLASGFGVRSLEESAQRLRALIDTAPTEHLIFFSHNGPTGLGDTAEAPWGCDFRPGAGDFGDPDLRAAIDFARERGRRTLAVLAGHMHWRLQRGGERVFQLEQAGVLYVNAARVPRIFDSGHGIVRHHLALSVTAAGAQVEQVLVSC
jgi:uncharacterized protein (TIGR04168 family)